MENTDKYEQVWHYLHSHQIEQDNLNTDIFKFLDLDYFQLLEKFSHANELQIILLKKKQSEDQNYLKSLQISFEHSLNNFTKRIGKVTHDNKEFQNRIIKDGYAYAVCPISGKILKSNQSILVEYSVVFYRFTGAIVFYLITGNLGAGLIKDSLYFPSYNLLVRYENEYYGFHPKHLTHLKAIILSNSLAFFHYFYNQNKVNKVCLLIGHSNFAHYLWNELSGLYRLKQNNLLKNIEQFFVLREPLGSISQIFPEISIEKIRYLEPERTLKTLNVSVLHPNQSLPLEVFTTIAEQNNFFVNVGDKFIPNGLTRTIYRIALQNTNIEVKKKIKSAKSTCFPLLWISIRTQDRTWLNQVEGLTQIINSLAQKFPKLGVVFDGFSLPADYILNSIDLDEQSLEMQLVKTEKEIVNKICQEINFSVKIFNIIGCSMFEANLWANAIDLYLCHFGTLQHKVGWLAIKPGLVHSNQAISSSQSSQDRTYQVREFGIPAKFINSSQIRDLKQDSFGTDLRSNTNNYEIDWQIIYDELVTIIDSIQQNKTLTKRIANQLIFIKQFLKSKFSKLPYFKKYF